MSRGISLKSLSSKSVRLVRQAFPNECCCFKEMNSRELCPARTSFSKLFPSYRAELQVLLHNKSGRKNWIGAD